MYKIFNVRAGFACNSSSTHSIIFVKDAQKRFQERFRCDDCGDFGWDYFTLVSEDAKMLYLASQICESMEDFVNFEDEHQKYKTAIVNKLLETNFEYLYDVDHQSKFCFPRKITASCYGKGGFIHEEFVRDIKKLFKNKNIMILGGNDNDSDHELLNFADKHISIPHILMDEKSYNLRCRKDDTGFWTIFNTKTGMKFRVLITEDDIKKEVPEKASAPELVDLKITDFCDKNCEFCYQNSSPEGKHAKFSDIMRIIDALNTLEVFEIAIGGGEPTFHPDFIEILQACKINDIVPNFSTRSTKWLRDNKQREKILECIGRFAFSIQGLSEAQEIIGFINYFDIDPRKVSFQIVNQTISKYELKPILNLASLNNIVVTILGFKTSGRGADFAESWQFKKNPHIWLDAVTELMDTGINIDFGLDTCIIEEQERSLKELGVPDWMYHKNEGSFSMYIDAVKGMMGPSSFCKPEEMIECKIKNRDGKIKKAADLAFEIQEGFKKF